jgi:hypothetical protein
MMRAFDASPTAPEDASGVAVYSTEGITGGLGKPGIPGDPHGNAEVAYVFASAPTPEPTALVALCGLGGVGLVGWARRRRATR